MVAFCCMSRCIQPGWPHAKDVGKRVKIQSFIPETAQKRSMKILSKARPRLSMVKAIPRAFKVAMKASEVNWHPWSELKTSGVPCSLRASSMAATQKSALSVFEQR